MEVNLNFKDLLLLNKRNKKDIINDFKNLNFQYLETNYEDRILLHLFKDNADYIIIKINKYNKDIKLDININYDYESLILLNELMVVMNNEEIK